MHNKLREVFGIDLRCLAAFRIAIALIVITDLALRSRFLSENYTDEGFLPRAFVRFPDCYMSLQMLDGSYAFQGAHFLVAGISSLMLLVGYRTRLATALCWGLTVSLHARNGFLLDAGDDLLRSLLFWSLFLPLGGKYSIDGRNSPQRQDNVVLSPATAALLLQFACVYFFAGWFKTDPEWAAGTAIECVLGQTLWTRPAGDAMRQHSELLRCLTPTVVWFEIIAPLCLFIPVRTRQIRMIVVPAFWMFQFGLATTIQLHIFPMITAAATVPFLSSVIWPTQAPTTRKAKSTVDSSGRRSRNRQSIVWHAAIALAAIAAISTQAANFGNGRFSEEERMVSLIGWNTIWSMYSTVPQFAYELSAEATLVGGETIDLVESEATNADRKRAQQLHGSYRFKYFLETALETGPEIPQHYLAWLIHHWNLNQPKSRFVRRARIMILTTAIRDPTQPETSVMAEIAILPNEQ